MKIYSNGRQNQFVNSCMVVAKLAGVEVEEVITTEEQRKAADYMSKFGHTKCPALETPEGCVTESVAIAKFFARKNADAKLLGASLWEEAQVDQWLAYTHTSLLQNFFKAGYGIFGWAPVDQEAFNESVKNLRESLKILNTHLEGKNFMVGEQITVADVVLAHFIQLIFQVLIEQNQRKGMPHLAAWFDKIASNEHYIKRNGKVQLCARPVKPQVAAAPKKEEKKGGKKEEVKKAEPKKEEKKKDETPKYVSTFNMFDFKTFFVNEADQAGKGMDELFAQFDPKGYTFWFTQYDKYEGEGEVLFQTQNLMNGFLQRADHMRKTAWGVMAILGDEPSLDIFAVWIFEGEGKIPEGMVDHPQFEYYTKRVMDLSKQEDKDIIKEFWCSKNHNGKLMGKNVQDLKMLK
jgi:elongation factor 1-gamma